MWCNKKKEKAWGTKSSRDHDSSKSQLFSYLYLFLLLLSIRKFTIQNSTLGVKEVFKNVDKCLVTQKLRTVHKRVITDL